MNWLLSWLIGWTLLLADTVRAAWAQESFAVVDQLVERAVADGDIPGAVVWIEQDGESYVRAYGNRQVVPEKVKMTVDTIFDLASLTKVVATTPSVLKLIELGKLKLDTTVRSLIADFTGGGRDGISVKHLLTHTSGLPPGIPREPAWQGYDMGIRLACQQPLRAQPGQNIIYSDINFILLGEIVRRVSGESVADFAKKHVFDPLGMVETGFDTSKMTRSRLAPTLLSSGVVHDPTAQLMASPTGHAGVFGTAADLAKYARMMLANGKSAKGKQVLSAETIRRATSTQTGTKPGAMRGLGWDLNTGFTGLRGDVFPKDAGYGHTGWTGTSLWIDPGSRTFVIVLSNRNHPSEAGRISDLRTMVSTHAALAVGLKRPQPVVPVLNGIDVLEKEQFARLKGLRLGLVTNHTGINRAGKSTIDLLAKAPDVQLKALFSPEHGIRGKLDQEKISDTKDEATGLPIYSLYGATRKPTAEQLRDLDALVFDIQDIGCRFYTYIGTMLYAMEAAAEQGKRFVVLDRINPITGLMPDGPIAEGELKLTACHPLPVRHGMTAGELAKMFVVEKKLNLKLEVVQLEGWKRAYWQDETGLPWLNPSPNMRSLKAAILYPGVGLLEFTNVSVGRGTDAPFERMGAPWIDATKLKNDLDALALPGVAFKTVEFTPKTSVFAGKKCSGVSFSVFNRDVFQPVDLGVVLAKILRKNHPQIFEVEKFQTLLFHPETLAGIKSGTGLGEIRKTWKRESGEFFRRRNAFLLYR